MKKTGLFFALAVTLTVLLAGCSKQNVSSVVLANAQPESQAASGIESSGPPPAASSQPAENPENAEPKAASSSPDGGTVSQNGPVLDITTDDKNFNSLFKNNPIDKQYISDSKTAASNAAMVRISEKYADVWQKEIDHAYNELTKAMAVDNSMAKPAALKAEQQKWESGKTAALKKIAADAQAEGGSMAQVDAASKTMDFYRSRAAQIYRELYGYDKNFTYNFSAK